VKNRQVYILKRSLKTIKTTEIYYRNWQTVPDIVNTLTKNEILLPRLGHELSASCVSRHSLSSKKLPREWAYITSKMSVKSHVRKMKSKVTQKSSCD